MELGRLGIVALKSGDRAQIVERAGEAWTVVQALSQPARVVEDHAGPRDVPASQREDQDERTGSSHSLTTSSARKLLGATAALSSARAARPLAVNAEIGKVFFAPATTSLTSSTVPCTDRINGGTS